MERERPDYLPPVEGRRWEFPWMTVIGIALVALMIGGVHMLTKTHAAWSARFDAEEVSAAPQKTAENTAAELNAKRNAAELEAVRAEIILRGVAERRRASNEDKQSEFRCISGTLFRRIPGGWENVPGQPC